MIHMMTVTLIKMINKTTRTMTMMAMVMIMTTTMMTKINDEHINIAATKDTFTGAQRAL